jgi:hypothetical protein
VAKKVMGVVREGRALLDYMDCHGYFVKRLPNGNLQHVPEISSSDIEEGSAKLRRLMSELKFTLAIGGADAMVPNALWLDIRPQTRNSGAWELSRRAFFPIPSDARDLATGDRDAWAVLNTIMHIAPQGNFPQRCSAPLPKEAGVCGNWFVKLTPTQHACSERCRQRKVEATSDYKEKKAKYAREHRERLKKREQPGRDVTLHCCPADRPEFASEERLEMIFDYAAFALVVGRGDTLPLMRQIFLRDCGEGFRARGANAVRSGGLLARNISAAQISRLRLVGCFDLAPSASSIGVLVRDPVTRTVLARIDAITRFLPRRTSLSTIASPLC